MKEFEISLCVDKKHFLFLVKDKKHFKLTCNRSLLEQISASDIFFYLCPFLFLYSVSFFFFIQTSLREA